MTTSPMLDTSMSRLLVPHCDGYEELHLKQDGVPPHFTFPIHLWLDSHFTGQWIGCGRPAEWPLCSVDLTARDAGQHSKCADLNQ
jgi:hypothetical protein